LWIETDVREGYAQAVNITWFKNPTLSHKIHWFSSGHVSRGLGTEFI
jgi:hypothetical protein